MKILLVSYYYPPMASAGGERPQKMAKYLPLDGHEVTVLTATYGRELTAEENIIRVYDPSHNKNRRGFRKWQWLLLRITTEILNVLGIYFSIYTLWEKSVLRRSNAILQNLKPDLVLATYPPVESLEIGLCLKKKLHIPLIADFRDGLLFEAVENKRMSRYGCIRRRYTEIETEAAALADAIITISPALSRYFSRQYGAAAILTMANGFDASDYADLPGKINLEKNKFNIVHTGSFGMSETGRSPSGLIEAMQSLAERLPSARQTIRLHLLGQLKQSEKRLLKKLRATGMVICHGTVSRPMALAFQKNADLLLLVTSVERRSVASSKLFEYLFAGKPILALTWNTYAADIVRETGCGWVIHPDRREEICSFLEAVSSNPASIPSLQRREELVARFSRPRQMRELAAFIDGLKKSKGIK